MLWCSPTLVTPLGCALTKNAPVSALERALTSSLDLKSFGIRIYKKVGGRGGSAGPTRGTWGTLEVISLTTRVRAGLPECDLRGC
jgi:hypothetical protein